MLNLTELQYDFVQYSKLTKFHLHEMVFDLVLDNKQIKINLN